MVGLEMTRDRSRVGRFVETGFVEADREGLDLPRDCACMSATIVEIDSAREESADGNIRD